MNAPDSKFPSSEFYNSLLSNHLQPDGPHRRTLTMLQDVALLSNTCQHVRHTHVIVVMLSCLNRPPRRRLRHARPLRRPSTGSHPSKSHSPHRIRRASGFLQTAPSKLPPRESSRRPLRHCRGSPDRVLSFPGTDLTQNPFSTPALCDQDGCYGESGDPHAMSLVPDPMYPLPIGNSLCHAAIQWNQEKDR